MSTELIARPKNEIAEKSLPHISQEIKELSGGTNVGYAENLMTNPTIVIAGSGTVDANVAALIDTSLSRTYCNLFIVKDVKFDDDKNCFIIGKDKALTHESSESFDIYGEDVRNFPTLFITTNRDYTICRNPGQQFYYGKVMEVNEQGKNIEIRFIKLFNKPMPQQRLNEIAGNIGINTGNGVDMLNHTNWLIKPLDIRKALTDAGIEYN